MEPTQHSSPLSDPTHPPSPKLKLTEPKKQTTQRPPSDSSDLSSFDGSDDEPPSRPTESSHSHTPPHPPVLPDPPLLSLSTLPLLSFSDPPGSHRSPSPRYPSEDPSERTPTTRRFPSPPHPVSILAEVEMDEATPARPNVVFPPAPQSLSSTLSGSEDEQDEEDDADGEDEEDEEDRKVDELAMDTKSELDIRPVSPLLEEPSFPVSLEIPVVVPEGLVLLEGEENVEKGEEEEEEEEGEGEDEELLPRSVLVELAQSVEETKEPLTEERDEEMKELGPEEPTILAAESDLLAIDPITEDPVQMNGEEEDDPEGPKPAEEKGGESIGEGVEEEDIIEPTDLDQTDAQTDEKNEVEAEENMEIEPEESMEVEPERALEGIKLDVVVTAVEENTPGALPPHSILAQQRSDAMEALLKIEIAFARLRDKFHVERMEQCLKEERQLLDETHPVLAHFQSRLADLRARELDFAAKRSKVFEASLEKVQQADVSAIWEWWRNGREELQRDMMADVMRKRRRVDREKRAVEGGRPKRALPIPPHSSSKRARQESPPIEDLLPGSFFHHRPEERRRIREEREAIGPHPGLLGLDERSRDGDLQLLGIGPMMRVRPYEQQPHPMMAPPNLMPHHHHHHPIHPPQAAQLPSQQYHSLHYAPGPPNHHPQQLGPSPSVPAGLPGMPYRYRQGIAYPSEHPHGLHNQPPQHLHLQPPPPPSQPPQSQQHNPHPFMFNSLQNGGSFAQPPFQYPI